MGSEGPLLKGNNPPGVSARYSPVRSRGSSPRDDSSDIVVRKAQGRGAQTRVSRHSVSACLKLDRGTEGTAKRPLRRVQCYRKGRRVDPLNRRSLRKDELGSRLK